MLKKLIGDKAFYRKVMLVAIPIIIQNGISNFVSLLDNIMVGQVGQLQMSGVAIVNQLIFVFYLCIFGAASGAGIFTAQFHGCRDDDNIRHTFRFKMIFCLFLSVAAICILTLMGTPLVMLYLKGEGSLTSVASTLSLAKQYLAVMVIGLIPYAISQCYGSTLREAGRATVPMIAGVIAVVINLVLNYILIFGKFGAPRLGVVGAAVATVISRFEILVLHHAEQIKILLNISYICISQIIVIIYPIFIYTEICMCSKCCYIRI